MKIWPPKAKKNLPFFREAAFIQHTRSKVGSKLIYRSSVKCIIDVGDLWVPTITAWIMFSILPNSFTYSILTFQLYLIGLSILNPFFNILCESRTVVRSLIPWNGTCQQLGIFGKCEGLFPILMLWLSYNQIWTKSPMLIKKLLNRLLFR